MFGSRRCYSTDTSPFSSLDAKKRRPNVTQGLLPSRILSTILLHERAAWQTERPPTSTNELQVGADAAAAAADAGVISDLTATNDYSDCVH